MKRKIKYTWRWMVAEFWIWLLLPGYSIYGTRNKTKKRKVTKNEDNKSAS